LGTVSLACKNADRSDLEEMERLIREMEGFLRTKDYARYSDLDLRFHFAVAHASKNRVLERILEDIRGLLSQLLKEVVLYLPGMAEKGNQYHKQILKALRGKDPRLADKAIRSHIASVAAAVQKYRRMKSS
jgi:GntR family transcriptional regulator, transcriptional repressor for pyruvate dehydrogenase complex